MKMKYRLACVLVLGFAVTSWGQQNAPPADKPADSGPSLAATMQFIQEKLTEQGQVAWAETRSNQPEITYRTILLITDVMSDPDACTLYITGKSDNTIELQKGFTLKQGGPLTADDLLSHTVETDTISFKQVEHIGVTNVQDVHNQSFVRSAHPEIKATVTPPVFIVTLWASNAVVATSHTSTTKGKQALVEKDITSKSGVISIRNEETANKVAKAMAHAVKLCGGGVTKKDLF
jgi:hypothetical protein